MRQAPMSKKGRLARFAVLLLALLVVACGGPDEQVETNPDNVQSNATQTQAPIVYTETSEESGERITDAAEMAREGDVDGAIAELKEALTDDPEAYLAAYNLGFLHDQRDEVDEARRYYGKALEIEPDFSPALLNLVRLEIRQGGDALGLADRHVSLRPENYEHKLARIEALLASGRYDEIVPSARVVLKADEANPRARYYMAFSHFYAGRFTLAEYIVDKALEIDALDPELHFLRGLIQLENPEGELRARDAFQRAVELRGDFPEAQNALGLSLYRAREFEAAEDAFRVALRYNPEFQEAYLNLGNALKAQTKGDEAEEAYLKALSFDENWGDVYFALGTLYLATELVPLSAFDQSLEQQRARLQSAEDQLKKAQELWRDGEDDALINQFLAKVQNGRDLLDAEEALQMMNGDGGGGGGGGCDDPFGCEEVCDDPFGCEETAPPCDDPFGCDETAPPCDDPFGCDEEEGAGGSGEAPCDDPFGCDEDDGGGGGEAPCDDPFGCDE